MEASSLPRSAALPRPRLGVAAPLLRMRSDDQLVALFRGGSDEAFRTIHDRYRVRLLAYSRQMLGGSTADAEDALQEVFVRAHAALLASSAPISLRAWLYRIAHNRCVDQLRRPSPIPSEIMPGAQPALCRGARHDPPAEAERSEDLRRLVSDVDALPEQQRSALLMRELQGLSYEELAVALGTSVAAVKSLLLRARGGVLDAAAARDVPCAEIRLELAAAHDRGVRASGRARRHMRECTGCCTYRGDLREVSRQVAALVPAGPLGHLGLVFGLGGGGAGGGIAAGGSGAVLGGAASVTATKVAALVCCAALVGSAAELRSHPAHHRARPAHPAAGARGAPAVPAADPRVVAREAGGTIAPTPPRLAAAATTTAATRATPATGVAAGTPLTVRDGYGASSTGTGTGSGAGADALGVTAATGPDPTVAATGGTPAAADPNLPAAPAAPGDRTSPAATTTTTTTTPAGTPATPVATAGGGAADDPTAGTTSGAAPQTGASSPMTAPAPIRGVAGERRIWTRRHIVRAPRAITPIARHPPAATPAAP